MGTCRVDTDLLRGLASQLGAAAVAVADAGPAVTLLEAQGFGPDATLVASRLSITTAWLQTWEPSLLTRADLVDAERAFFTTATIASPGALQSAADQAALATHLTDPFRLEDVTTAAAARGARFRAARARLESAQAEAQEALAKATGWALIAHLHELAVLEELAAPHRRYLEFDWEGGRIVEWIGPANARHLAVYVPGAGISKLDFPRLAARVGGLVDHDPTGGDLAVIVALAYDPPPTVAHAALGGYADDGGTELIDLLAGVELGGRHVTVIGHSYGSVVVGAALREGLASQLPADYDIVALGSPGMRADHVTEFGIDPARFWAARLPGDAIAYAVHASELVRLATCSSTGLSGLLEWCQPGPKLIHGVDPTHPSFEGRAFGETAPHAGFDAHTDYLAAEVDGDAIVPSFILRELIRIVVGGPPADD